MTAKNKLIARRYSAVVSVAIFALALVIVPSYAQTAPGQTTPTTGFIENFSGRPSSPLNYANPNNWDIMVFGVDARQPNLAQHGPACEAPGFPYVPGVNTHSFSTQNQAVFICNDHVMTSVGVAGYGAVYMTPPAVADFSAGSARIAWDMSTLRTSSRDWVYITITPFSEHHELPYINTDQHIPPHNIKIALAGTDNFELFQNGGFQNSKLGNTDTSTTWDDVFRAQTPPTAQSPVRRDTFEITLSRTNISLCMPNYTWRGQQPFCWARNVVLRESLSPDVWGDQASVQFTHVSYNAEKSCEQEAIDAGYTDDKGQPTSLRDQFDIVHNAFGDEHCPSNTWHWDNVSINPAVPYSVIQSNPPDFISNSGSAFRVNFLSPAPINSNLSFVSWGDTPKLQVSYNNGSTWLQPRFQQATAFAHSEVGENVMMPIPAGQQSVMVRGGPGYWGTFQAIAFKIVVNPSSQPVIPPTPGPIVVPPTVPPTVVVQPTTVPTQAPTQVLPSSTSTSVPTATPTITPEPTVTPESTVTPTPSNTSTPVPTATLTPTIAPTIGPTLTPEPTPMTVGSCEVNVVVVDGHLEVTEKPC